MKGKFQRKLKKIIDDRRENFSVILYFKGKV